MSDYARIAEAIAFITRNARRQPSLEEVAAHLHLSPYHFQRLFARWAGISPKRFLQTLTLEHAKQRLREPRPLLEVAHEVGLSGGSRLHDHFVTLEAITPGEFRQGGRGLVIEYAVHPTPFGEAFIAVTPRGICTLSFLDSREAAGSLEQLRREWPLATLVSNPDASAPAAAVLNAGRAANVPLSLHVRGTNFQIQVWRALLQIPFGAVANYSEVAAALGRPRAARSVATAIGANPVAVLIPCHRVIRQSGELTGYRWGAVRKRAVLAWESVGDGR
ncbi:methylated-DNA--[protein]-cysteine S-methyltransferase [Endothiovibrio diazotrophicus]